MINTPALTSDLSSDPIEGQPLPPAAPGAQWQATAERERVDREAPYMEASRGLALGEVFSDAQLGGRLFGFLEADAARARATQRHRVFGDISDADAPLSADQANARFGIEGRLRFDAPVSEPIAAWRQGLAQREAFRDEVLANADVSPLAAIGASLAGALLDPAGLPLWLIPELATGRALRSGAMATRLGRLAPATRGAITGAAEGAAGGLAFEGVNLWLHHEASDDYDFGAGSANIAFGALLGAGFGALGEAFGGGRAAHRPRVVEDMPEPARAGAFAEALDAAIEDRPVDLGPLLARDAEARASGRSVDDSVRMLDETVGGEGPALGGRRLHEDVAITTTGEEIPVRYRLIEADDLITSHDDDMFRNGQFPPALQPRDRGGRAGSKAYNVQLEGRMNPKLLMRDVSAAGGAPIIDRTGVVESGNGRTIALRRNGRAQGALSKAYRAELEAQGIDTTGFENPILVRERQTVLTGTERKSLAGAMNEATVEGYSPSERAMADAGGVDDDLLGLIAGADLTSAANRRFVRAFLDRNAGADLNRMTTADGALSDVGLQRIQAAMVARAYGDRGLVEALFEATDNDIKAIGKALAEAAPEWAAMRAAALRGEVPPDLDPTAALTAAVNFVRTVRGRGGNLADSLDLIIDQVDAFDGVAMTPETEAFLRSFFRTDKEGVTRWNAPRGATSLADGLRWLAAEIQKAEPGPNLFGDVADATTARTLLDTFAQWFRRVDAGDTSPLDFGPDPTAIPAGRDAGPSGDPPGRQSGGQGAGEQAAGAVAKPKVAKGQAPAPPKGQPFADPELAALQADTEAHLALAGIDPADVAAAITPAEDPQTLADAISAAAWCLKGGS